MVAKEEDAQITGTNMHGSFKAEGRIKNAKEDQGSCPLVRISVKSLKIRPSGFNHLGGAPSYQKRRSVVLNQAQQVAK